MFVRGRIQQRVVASICILFIVCTFLLMDSFVFRWIHLFLVVCRNNNSCLQFPSLLALSVLRIVDKLNPEDLFWFDCS